MSNEPRALVIGGTGPTGPHIVNGLMDRGYVVTLFHRGTHERSEIPESVEHIHGDPHFTETIQSSLGSREFDVVLAMYGRTRLLARHFAGRVERFIAIGGTAAYQGHFAPESLFPSGMVIPTTETEPLVQSEAQAPFGWRVAQTEREVMDLHPKSTIFRYPLVYGSNQVLPLEWGLVRRALDRRPFLLLPDGGLPLIMRGYALNLAHAVLCAVDRPEVACGQIYNCGDERQLTLGQLAEVIGDALGHQWEIIGVPSQLAQPAWATFTPHEPGWHLLTDIGKLKSELGYRDRVPAVTAVADTVRWYAERRDELAPSIERWLGDPFDYVAEDQLACDWKRCQEQLVKKHGRPAVERPHTYPHPKVAGFGRDQRGR